MAMSYFYQIPSYERDQVFAKRALEAFDVFLGKHPESPLASDAKEKIKAVKEQLAKHVFSIAEFYYRTDAYHAAIQRFRRVLLDYSPQTDTAEKALMYLAYSHLSQGSVEEARAIYRLFFKKFPQSVYADDVKKYLDR
jgi:outer membrane protein assembly factor BamD